MPLRPARNCGLSRNTSWSRLRCVISSGDSSLQHSDIRSLSQTMRAIQLNDTHPALTVAEMMRMLVDEQILAGMKRGLSLRPPAATRITR